jgi:hypothetical protein
MRDRICSSVSRTLIASLAIGLLAACDSVDAGRPADPEGGPSLVHIMIINGDLYVATDALYKAPPSTLGPPTECNLVQPCNGDVIARRGLYGFPACENAEGEPVKGEEMGTCPDPMDPMVTPPVIGPLTEGFDATQIRFVFDQLLDPAIAQEMMATDADGNFTQDILQLVDESGNVTPMVDTYFDPGGAPFLTSDPIALPYGPALVLKPAPLSADTTYTFRLKPERVKDRDGNAATTDIFGAIKTEYMMKTEPLKVSAWNYAGLAPDFVAEAVTIAPDDYFQMELNANVDPMTSTSSVVSVTNTETMEMLSVRAIIDCTAGAEDLRLVDIVHTSSTGAVIPWPEGTYSITVNVKGDNGHSVVTYDGSSPVEGMFTVDPMAEVTNNIADVVLPEDCGAAE